MNSTSKRLRLPKDDFSRSIAGFLIAFAVGALVPRTVSYVVRKAVVKSFRDIFFLAAAGWLTDYLVQLIARSGSK